MLPMPDRDVGFHLKNALDLHRNGEVEKARHAYLEVINLDPAHVEALYLTGLIDFSRRHFESAANFFAQAISLSPHHFQAMQYCGVCLNELLLYKEAIGLFDSVLANNPANSEVYFQKANAFHKLKQIDDAIENYKQAILFNSEFYEAHHNCGLMYFSLNQFEQALNCFNQALCINPKFAVAYSDRGLTLKELFRYEEALEDYNRALVLNPNFAEAFYNRGILLQELNQTPMAIDSYSLAIQINPNLSEAYNNRGLSFQQLGNLSVALQDFEFAINLNPEYCVAFVNRGAAYQRLAQIELAVQNYQQAFNLLPNYAYLFGALILTRMQLCDWESLSSDLLKLEQEILKLKKVTDPFPALVLFDDPKLHQIAAQLYADDKAPPNPILGDIEPRPTHNRIRLGFYSADLRWHPVAIWLAEQVENHDKSKFELFAFSFRSDVKDPMQQRLQAAFDHFIEVDTMSDLEVVRLSRELEIDIALDLGGHTQDSRPGIFAARAAPIQLNHLGFPGSMGAEYIDYIIGHIPSPDEDLEELAINRQFMTEKIVYVPSSFTYDRQRQLSDEPLTRTQFGLPETGFVFTCQNGCQKLMPEVFDIWMEILKAVPGSVLWLLKPNETAVKNLIKEANSRGVEAERLIFTAREVVPIDQEGARIGRYLASYKLADLFLDTWPYNAGTTAIDALWAGLPVLTKEGKAGVARMAAGALRGIEVPELITKTQQEYKELAIELAHSPEKLKQLKEKVQANRLTTALFDPVGNTRHIENAYLSMVQMLNEN
jgi:predicted O-linked N-acetylglucosamine transferase (SPINDLY family)